MPNGFEGTLVGLVDTRVGTGGYLWLSGQNTPAAAVPFGRIELGPDTQSFGRSVGTAGYHYGDVILRGFSHTRLVGSGVFEGGVLRVLPLSAPKTFAQLRAWRPTFTHQTEIAVPGYYAVTVRDGNVRAELTATPRVGIHRYTFPSTATRRLVVDLTSRLGRNGRVKDVTATVVPGDNRVVGSLTLLDDFSARYGGLPVFFVIAPETPILSYRFLTASGATTALSAPSDDTGLYLELELDAPAASPLGLRVALSHVDATGAADNLVAEAPPGQDFDAIRQAAHATWESWLSRIRVTGDATRRRIFYTALFNALRMPTILSDAPKPDTTRRVLGFDKQIHVLTGVDHYSDFSLWDTYRTVHPLYNLIAREAQRQMIQSLIRMADESGRLPLWAAGVGHADSMLGLPANIVIAESWLKGITGFDTSAAYDHMKKAATVGSGRAGRVCYDEYVRYGYCPADLFGDSVSFTVEYAYADHALGTLAASLGKNEDAAVFLARGGNWRNLWHPLRQALVPRRTNGTFLENFSLWDLSYVGITEAAHHYREGSAGQYRWLAPHDPTGLRQYYGEAMFPLLEEFFQRAPQSLGSIFPSSQYWHGNEHDLHAVALFNAAGRPDRTQYWHGNENDLHGAAIFNGAGRPARTQYWTRWVQDTKYAFNSVGLDGNDDGGTLSSWYVLTSLGLFPIAGTTRYELTSPLFDAEIDIDAAVLRVRREGGSATSRYVRGARWNGVRLPEPRIEHAVIGGGGDLVFEMSDTPAAWEGT